VLKPINVVVEPADHSNKFPIEIIENVLVKVKDMIIIIIDFVVMDIKDDDKVPMW